MKKEAKESVALKPDITAIAVCEDGSSIRYEGDLEIKDQLSIEKLINAVGQLEDLREEREEISEGLLAGLEDNDFAHDVAAIDTALAAIKRLIDIDTFDAKDARPSAKWECMDNVYRLHAGECNLSAAKCSNCNSVICDIFHVSERLLYCPVCGARMEDGKFEE